MNDKAILIDIHALEHELLTFERTYGVRSETLYAAYMSGEEPEDDARGCWILANGRVSIAHGSCGYRKHNTKFG